MREPVYLSEGKLAQFLPGPRDRVPRDGDARYVVAGPLNVEHTDPPERP